MLYLYVNRAIGVVALISFIFFACAVSAIRGSEIKADFQDWARQRKLRKLLKPTKKGLHR